MTTLIPGKRGKSRGEITDTVDRSSQDMDDKLGDLDKIRADAVNARETLASLEFRGTDEGNDSVERSFQEADTATVDVFDQEDDTMDGIQADNEEYQGELQEHSDTDESDLGKVSDATGQINTEVTNAELLKAKDAVLQDIDFLISQIDQARDEREKSEQTQQDYRNQVHSGR